MLGVVSYMGGLQCTHRVLVVFLFGFLQERGVRAQGRGDGGGEHRGGNLLDLTGAPGLEYMSEAEILLCSQLHMMPSYYLTIKASASARSLLSHLFPTCWVCCPEGAASVCYGCELAGVKWLVVLIGWHR